MEKILHHNKVAAGHFHTATCPSTPHLALQDFFLLQQQRTDFKVIITESLKIF
jgi:hypothetical protein